MTNEEINKTLLRMRPFLVDKTFGEDFTKYISHLLSAYQTNLEKDSDTTSIFRSQGRIEVLKKLHDLPEAVKKMKEDVNA